MLQQELETRVRAKLSEDTEMHERIARIEVLLEQLVGNGKIGRVRENELAIRDLRRIVWLGTGICGTLVFLVKYVF